MKFIVPINDAAPGESQTCHVVETNSTNRRVNKRKLRKYFQVQGVPTSHLKRVMKAMNFTGKALGR